LFEIVERRGIVATERTRVRIVHTGWSSRLSRTAGAALLFLTATGLAVTFAPFHAVVQWSLLLHTLVGLATLAPVAWYCVRHWRDYRSYQLSHVVLLGYVGAAGLLVCLVSGLAVTWEGAFETRMSPAWRQAHLVSTFVTVGAAAPHVFILVVRLLRIVPEVPAYVRRIAAIAAIGVAVVATLPIAYSGTAYVNTFPADYSYAFGKDRPFAPSLAKTSTGGAFDPRTLAGSASCGTSGCHTQIVKEWLPSAHRYAAMDPLFQAIQTTMAKQNGPESTRYCGGCHDPISLFSGTKNIFARDLTTQHGYQEGVSCLACHSIRDTDVKGNAAYTVTQPSEYLWQWQTTGAGRLARDFLIRTYPSEHNKLSKRMFKTPAYCAACHKQFIDAEVNRVGWVQLQNQYDNWANSHWNSKGNPRKTVECRECHMPLVESSDPAAGDAADYNRAGADGKHRSHRFLAANQLVPRLLGLEGWAEHVRLTEDWLQGEVRIPEIADKWASGAVVQVALDVGAAARPGVLPIRVVLTSNKVGHDYPTGPLDMIQSWIELHVVDEQGQTIFSSGTRDDRNFIAPGSFLFKAEPVDQHGNLIDRHNLWEMVGVRFRRSLFPGYSDTVEYAVDCGATFSPMPRSAGGDASADRTALRQFDVPAPGRPGRYTVTAILQYRKVDQFLANYMLGENSGITAPVVEISRAKAVFVVDRPGAAGRGMVRMEQSGE
jgi:hypothetical protein